MRKVLYLLGQLSDADVHWMGQAGERQKLASGTSLIQFGVTTKHIYIVLDGELVIQSNTGIEFARVGTGEVLGEMSLLDERPPSASVKTATEVTLLALDKKVLKAKLDKDMAFSSRFYRSLAVFLSNRMRTTIANLGYGSAPEQAEDPDELDSNVLDNVHLAGARFDRLLKTLMG